MEKYLLGKGNLRVNLAGIFRVSCKYRCRKFGGELFGLPLFTLKYPEIISTPCKIFCSSWITKVSFLKTEEA